MAATNKGLDNAVKMGIFREDLYYRLNGKCHGSVAFPLGPDENCRRCHSLPKRL